MKQPRTGSALCFLVLLCFAPLACAKDRVKLRDVEVLTLRKGEMTAGRRSRPVPQLKCTEGCQGDRFDVAQCYNRGSDGADIQWECKAEMPAGYRFGKTVVSCEGYDNADDEYILRGSCGLEYDLRPTQSSSHAADYSSKSSDGGFSFIGLLVLGALVFLAYVIYQNVSYSPTAATTGSMPSPPPYSESSAPPPYGFAAEYMPSHDSCGSSSHRYASSYAGSAWPGMAAGGSASSSGGGSFWTGAATGGALGYLFGQRSAASTTATSSAFSTQPSAGGSRSRSDSDTHVSTGYASTKRR